MTSAFRVTKTRYLSSAFSGEGAKRYGGRWNPAGTSMVYLAGSLSLATLEIFVHTENYATIYGLFSYIEVGIPENLIEKMEIEELPGRWNSPEVIPATQAIGEKWIASGRSVALSVPSAVTRGEWNFLVNPLHPEFAKLKIGEPEEFRLDPRLANG